MNDQLQEFARSELKSDLAKLSENHRIFFKRMYSHNNPDAEINDVVDGMPEEKLDWAMQQVQRTLEKQNKM